MIDARAREQGVNCRILIDKNLATEPPRNTSGGKVLVHNSTHVCLENNVYQ
jgi:hypothetical protein